MNKYIITGKTESGKTLLSKIITNKDETYFLDGKLKINTYYWSKHMDYISSHKINVDTICIDDFVFNKNFKDLDEIISKFPEKNGGITTLIINTEEKLTPERKEYFEKNDYQIVDIEKVNMKFIMNFLEQNSIFLK